LQQYAGRLHREHADKQDVRIYDYAETDQPQLNRMWDKRQRGYRTMGYEIKPMESVVLGNCTHNNSRKFLFYWTCGLTVRPFSKQFVKLSPHTAKTDRFIWPPRAISHRLGTAGTQSAKNTRQ